jgi:hypothetical protein
MVLAEWKKFPMPTGQVFTQPTGFTLIRFPTVFYTNINVHPIHTTILGRRVTIRPKPQFTWDFGDGTTLTTDDPGRQYPHETVTHKYQWREPRVPFKTRVTITYTATYSVDGGAAQPVPGQVVMPGPVTDLLVKTARTVLVDPNAPLDAPND